MPESGRLLVGSATTARIVLVTAGTAGLARGVVVALARAGYRTAFTYREGGTAPAATLAAVRAAGADAFAVAADFDRRGEGAAAVAEVERQCGRIDALVQLFVSLGSALSLRSSVRDPA